MACAPTHASLGDLVVVWSTAAASSLPENQEQSTSKPWRPFKCVLHMVGLVTPGTYCTGYICADPGADGGADLDSIRIGASPV
jgi:hypothetical protein